MLSLTHTTHKNLRWVNFCKWHTPVGHGPELYLKKLHQIVHKLLEYLCLSYSSVMTETWLNSKWCVYSDFIYWRRPTCFHFYLFQYSVHQRSSNSDLYWSIFIGIVRYSASASEVKTLTEWSICNQIFKNQKVHEKFEEMQIPHCVGKEEYL